MDILFTELPGTFRVCGSREDVMAVMNAQVLSLAEELNASPSAVESGSPYLTQLDWYPGGMGWQICGGRSSLKRRESAEFSRLRTFVVEQTSLGYLSRQEAVSMIPPLFMNVQEHHRVLDMCAAPGSKTAQLIEMLHQTASEPYNPSAGKPHPGPTSYNHMVRGFVHANDASSKRCNTLITQTRRLSSPSLLVTQHNAQSLPVINILPPSELAEHIKPPRTLSPFPIEKLGTFQYDRILCDVPCSGDGTLRKNPDLWTRWKPSSALGLHQTQIDILTRAIALSAPGARIVYSTCSMHPAEDEAVIATALQTAKHQMKLVDVSNVLPRLKFRPGLHTWQLMDNEGNLYSKFEEVPELLKGKLVATAFPPGADNAADLHLERCMRFLPHDQDTGGFFVAVLERVDQEADADKKEKKAKYRKPQPAEYEKLEIGVSSDICGDLVRFFGLSGMFPKDQLVKHQRGVQKLYLATHAASVLVDQDYSHRLKVKTIGVRVFEHITNTQGSTCSYRLTQDGITAMYPFLGPRRVVHINDHDFNVLFETKDPLFTDFSAETKQQLEEMEIGSAVFSYNLTVAKDLPTHHILLVGWRGKVSTHTLIKPTEMSGILALFKSRDSGRPDDNGSTSGL